jgi:hypothetical protein
MHNNRLHRGSQKASGPGNSIVTNKHAALTQEESFSVYSPVIEFAPDPESYAIENRKIMNKGIGYIDVHLLGSALVSDTPIWTFDKALKKMASQLSVGYDIK